MPLDTTNPLMTTVICPQSRTPVASEIAGATMSTSPNVVHPRFALTTTVAVRETANGAAVLAKLKNISLSGCYLETPRLIPENARVRVVLQTAGVRADLWGVVQRRDEAGLGIRFTNGSTVEDWKALELLIEALQGNVSAMDASASTSSK
jgi:hypothetical protein